MAKTHSEQSDHLVGDVGRADERRSRFGERLERAFRGSVVAIPAIDEGDECARVDEGLRRIWGPTSADGCDRIGCPLLLGPETMASTAMRDRESLPDEIIDAIIARVRDESGVAVSALRLGKLSRRAHAQLLSVLARSNLEHTGKAIRVPLRDQVRAAVARAGEAGIATKALAREVKGARSAAELGLVIRDLIADGKLVIVTEGRAQRAAAPGPQWLSEAELVAVADVAQALAGLAKATRAAKGKPRPTLGRAVFDHPLRVLQQLAGRSDAAPARAAMQMALKVAPARAGLVRVPDVVRALETEYAHAALLDALDAMARDGTLELRPESAIAGLSAEDRARCPIAVDGTPLSYARLLAGGRP